MGANVCFFFFKKTPKYAHLSNFFDFRSVSKNTVFLVNINQYLVKSLLCLHKLSMVNKS